MTKTASQRERAAAEALDALDQLDLSATEDASDLRRIGDAVGSVAKDERELTEAVVAARACGRSWAMIGLALGVSRQAAHDRFSHI